MQWMGLAGIIVFMLMGYGLSCNRKKIHWKTIAWGLGLQWVLAFIILKGDLIQHSLSFIPVPPYLSWFILVGACLPTMLKRLLKFQHQVLNWSLFVLIIFGLLRLNLIGSAFDRMRIVVEGLMAYAGKGATFIFGPLQPPNFFVFAFTVLPVIIFVASVFGILYYLGIMQFIVGGAAKVMGQFLKISGAESVSVAASIMMGQTEAPLTIRPFLGKLTRSELMVVMTAGMAHVSGSIMVAYVQMAKVDIVHLLTAVIMTAPGAVMMAKLIIPETEIPETQQGVAFRVDNKDANILDAAARGAFDGGQLAFNVAVMLIAFISLVALANGILSALNPTWSLEAGLKVLFRPLALVMGVPSQDATIVGGLLGKRMVINEFVAFAELGQIPLEQLSAHGRLITTFALCGFANFSSIAIQIGGIGSLIPERRGDLANLGFRAMIAGTLANFISACIAGVLT